MPALKREQIRKLLEDAGFKKNGVDTEIMVGIAYAESGGDPTKHNNKPPDDSYGLWQINMLGKMGPARRRLFGISSNDQLFDPATNARAAKKIYDTQGLNAWSTYDRGEYLKFMDKTTTEEGGNQVPSVDIGNPLTGLKESVTGAASTLQRAITSFAGAGIGLALLAIGVVILLRNQVPAKKVLKAVTK